MLCKGTLSPKQIFSYMKDITSLNIIHKVIFSFSPPFSSKIADLAENVRLEGPEKQAIVSCSGLEKQAISLQQRAKEIGTKCPVAKASNSNCSCLFGSHIQGADRLHETHCLLFWPATGDLLPVSLAHYMRLLPLKSDIFR